MAQKWNLEFFSETHYICKSVHKTSPRTLFFMFVACPACWRNTCVQSAHAGTTKKVFLLEFNFNRIQEKKKKCFAFLFFSNHLWSFGKYSGYFFAFWSLLLPPGSTARSFFLLSKNSEQCTDAKQKNSACFWFNLGFWQLMTVPLVFCTTLVSVEDTSCLYRGGANNCVAVYGRATL